jgi:sortase A
MTGNPRFVWLNRALIAFGAVCLMFYSAATVSTWRYQRDAKAAVSRMVAGPGAASGKAVPAAARVLKKGDLIGRVDIPRIKLSAAVAEGDDDTTLDKAVGHLPDTPLPWHRRGNVAFAAHRDGLFRKLEHVRVGDEVRVVTIRGEFHYRVTKTHIVDPDDVWVLAPTKTPTITLITCYPFSFVGNAPQRFVVQAEMADALGAVVKGSAVK